MGNKSDSFSSQYCIASILEPQYCTQLSHSNIKPTLQSFSGSIPKSGIMAIHPQDVKSDNYQKYFVKKKKLLPFVTSQESQPIERSPLIWDELSVTSQQDIKNALGIGKPPLNIIAAPNFKKTTFFRVPIFPTSGADTEIRNWVSVTSILYSVFVVTVNQQIAGLSQSSSLPSPPEKAHLLDATQPAGPGTSNMHELSTVLQLETEVFQSQEKPRLLLPANVQVKTEFRCEACTKMFPHNQPLLFHKRTCNISKKENPELEFESTYVVVNLLIIPYCHAHHRKPKV